MIILWLLRFIIKQYFLILDKIADDMVYDFGGFVVPGVLSIPKECDYGMQFIADKSGYIVYAFIFAYTGFWGDFLGGVHGCSFRGYYI